MAPRPFLPSIEQATLVIMKPSDTFYPPFTNDFPTIRPSPTAGRGTKLAGGRAVEGPRCQQERAQMAHPGCKRATSKGRINEGTWHDIQSYHIMFIYIYSCSCISIYVHLYPSKFTSIHLHSIVSIDYMHFYPLILGRPWIPG